MAIPSTTPIGTHLYSQGLNGQCRPCICKCQLVAVKEDGDPVTLHNGVRLIDSWDDLYLTRAEVQAAIDAR